MNTLPKDFELPVLFDDEDGFFIPMPYTEEEDIREELEKIGQAIYMVRGMLYSPEVRKSLKNYFNDEELEKMQNRIVEMLRMQ